MTALGVAGPHLLGVLLPWLEKRKEPYKSYEVVIMRIDDGDPPPVPHDPSVGTLLPCRDCKQDKPFEKFRHDSTAPAARWHRRYYCNDCETERLRDLRTSFWEHAALWSYSIICEDHGKHADYLPCAGCFTWQPREVFPSGGTQAVALRQERGYLCPPCHKKRGVRERTWPTPEPLCADPPDWGASPASPAPVVSPAPPASPAPVVPVEEPLPAWVKPKKTPSPAAKKKTPATTAKEKMPATSAPGRIRGAPRNDTADRSALLANSSKYISDDPRVLHNVLVTVVEEQLRRHYHARTVILSDARRIADQEIDLLVEELRANLGRISRRVSTRNRDYEKVAFEYREDAALLGVRVTASPKEIDKAWKQKMRTAHSDVGGSDEAAAQLNQARDNLRMQRRVPCAKKREK